MKKSALVVSVLIVLFLMRSDFREYESDGVRVELALFCFSIFEADYFVTHQSGEAEKHLIKRCGLDDRHEVDRVVEKTMYYNNLANGYFKDGAPELGLSIYEVEVCGQKIGMAYPFLPGEELLQEEHDGEALIKSDFLKSLCQAQEKPKEKLIGELGEDALRRVLC